MEDPHCIINKVAQILFEKKGFNITALDVRGICTLTDFFLFAEGNVDRHVIALAKEVIETLKAEGEAPLHVEGMSEGEWVVIDYLDVVIHLFKPGIRDRYRLEELWQAGKVVDLELGIKGR